MGGAERMGVWEKGVCGGPGVLTGVLTVCRQTYRCVFYQSVSCVHILPVCVEGAGLVTHRRHPQCLVIAVRLVLPGLFPSETRAGSQGGALFLFLPEGGGGSLFFLGPLFFSTESLWEWPHGHNLPAPS